MPQVPDIVLPEGGLPYDDYYSATSITLGELHDMGFFDASDASWRWDAYSDDQYYRVMSMILERYRFRELGIMPVYRWKAVFMRHMNEIMPKYKVLYAREEQGVNPMQDSSEYAKERIIFSDFPATLLSGNSDYTSTGTDKENEVVREGDIVTQSNDYAERYRTVDVMILDDLDFLFTCVLTSTVPLF